MAATRNRPRIVPCATNRQATASAKSRNDYTFTMLIAFNKPFRVMCQFTGDGGRRTLADYIQVPDVYPAGRLDYDSEGLLLLTDEGALAHRICDPAHKWPKTYLLQVEGTPQPAQLAALRRGVDLNDGLTAPADASALDAAPEWLWARDPPVRYRKTVADGWIRVAVREGRNRQVRRMTAAVGLPTLRLIRIAIGPYSLDGLAPGAWRAEAPGAFAGGTPATPRRGSGASG
jgi:23S rRNA pseudouridine2457 synthase